MSDDSRAPVTCPCGKTVQKRSYSQHCSSKHHVNYFLTENNANSSMDMIVNLSSYLRELDLRTNQQRIQNLVEKYHHTDPYTKAKLKFESDESIPDSFHVDHIHEAQILACAIKHTPELLPRNGNILALRPLRRVLNDMENLTITEASVNRSKGQAVKYFLGHYETNTDISLIAAFIQTANGKERSIAYFAVNIIDLIKETSSSVSDSIRDVRSDNGQINGQLHYESLAEQFDTIIDRMKLDWKENIKLRNGKIYQAYP